MLPLHPENIAGGSALFNAAIRKEVIDTIAKKFGFEVIHGDEIASMIPQNGVPSSVKTKKGRENMIIRGENI